MAYPVSEQWISGVLWLTFVVTCISGLHYMFVWTRKAASEESR